MNIIDTAYFTAACRAQESARPDALLHDPLAGQLAGDRGLGMLRDAPDTRHIEDAAWSVVVRTLVMDQMIDRLLRDQSVDAILNLGAGLDTRPYRMSLPGMVDWIEMDLQPVMYRKTGLPAVDRYAVDLTDSPERDRALDKVTSRFDRVLVISEGLISYLTAGDFRNLAASLTRPQFRWWLTDIVSPLHARRSERLLDMPMYPRDTMSFTVWGWRELMYRSLTGESTRLGRGTRVDRGSGWSGVGGGGQCHMPRSSGVVLLESTRVLPG